MGRPGAILRNRRAKPVFCPMLRALAAIVVILSVLFAPADTKAGDAAPIFVEPADRVANGPPPCAGDAGEEAVVRAVHEDGTLALANGLTANLAGIDLPRPALDESKASPRAAAARRFVAGLVEGEKVRLFYSGRRHDRHGRALAEIVRVRDGRWVQGALVASGVARVRVTPDHPGCAKALLALEAGARNRRLGNWSDSWYRVFRAGDPDLIDHRGRFEIVEGRVRSVGRGRDRVYLNFGARWTTDFTIMIVNRDLPRFRATPKDPDRLRGRTIRVRGMLRSEGGPAIYALHPDMIEIVQ